MEQVIVNLIGSTRRETLNGREHIVAPLSLIVPGVLNGSRGPLYYPPEEVAKDPSIWNHVPIVVYHPIVDGQQVSARDPDVLNAQGIGVVLRATISNGKLKAEGWFDIERTNKVDPRILTALEQGQQIELSTGLFTDNTPAPEGAAHNGTAYDRIARNYRPDHLAILPDQQGACSIADGCGVLVNDAETETATNTKGSTSMATKLNDEDKAAVVNSLINNCDCWDEKDREVLNTFNDGKLQALQQRAEQDQQTLLVANAATTGFKDEAGNSHTYNSDTGNWDSTMAEVKTPEPKAVEEEETAIEPRPPQTTNEWMATAPVEIQSAVRNAMEIEAREKAQVIYHMTANVSEEARPGLVEALQGKELSELRTLSALTPAAPAASQEPTASYAGAAAPVGNAQASDFDKDDLLPLPTINWAKENSSK
jgi:hypothetical protein